MIAFGPIRSRRLGRSLGVNNVPYKFCTYSCVYCQLGPTRNLTTKRREFYDPERILKEVSRRFKESSPDYVTFVPDGEPTLDKNLGREISMIKELGAKTAVLTNSSLLFMEDVRNDLFEADLISVKVDAVSQEVWRRVNRPHPSLKLREILCGILDFSSSFDGIIISETMIFEPFFSLEEVAKVAEFLKEAGVDRAYLTAPVRPPAEHWVKIPDEKEAFLAFQEFYKRLGKRVEMLMYPEPPEAYSSGNFELDVLSISSVHPIREEMMRKIMKEDGASEEDLRKILAEGKIKEIEYEGKKYYVRSFRQISAK